MKINIVFPLFILTLCILSTSVHAQEYILELQQIVATDEAQLKPKIPAAQLAELGAQGYTIMSRNEKPTEFYFAIDHTFISFSDLSQGGNFSKHMNVKIKSSTNVQYQILTKLTSPLRTITGETIESTSCDNRCTSQTASIWNSADVYGFGFSTDNEQTFRPFSSQEATVLFLPAQGKSDIKMTLKIQTPRNQPEGNYQGAVQLIALPEL
ncbi:MAG: hypothetical protein US54_C0061G0004 [Candidatus Roizmanbacteria bacterium GW2011_GWA2_37_7]|uniref:Uncharacterized protein n=1 Tax=Candidatus Roizmanbacteria bacterium GW2011_GWA2_37_7 TaxID=1618481 RepID=A0A0G0HDM7_9BACT|nr:MAG: hypothetical protein US54_C0061G0004 [Candidatus Roizmanbacteria bacterium GW2011_GWA2_37_7]